MVDFRKQFAKRLKDIRNSKGLSQEQIAERVGVEPKTVSYWENGHNAITFGKIPLIADALGVPVYKLFVFTDFESNPNALMDLLKTANPTEMRILESIIKHVLMLK